MAQERLPEFTSRTVGADFLGAIEEIFTLAQSDEAGRLLLIQRTKAPNLGCWSPIGGKLEMGVGESPFECAVRETFEETGVHVATEDLHLFGMISEKGYEGQSHWLMFLFDCRHQLAVDEQCGRGVMTQSAPESQRNVCHHAPLSCD